MFCCLGDPSMATSGMSDLQKLVNMQMPSHLDDKMGETASESGMYYLIYKKNYYGRKFHFFLWFLY